MRRNGSRPKKNAISPMEAQHQATGVSIGDPIRSDDGVARQPRVPEVRAVPTICDDRLRGRRDVDCQSDPAR
jgi:hypothetical protein